MRVVDAHQHLWDLDAVEYPWLTPDAGPIYRTFGWSDLSPELAATGVDATVLVQAANSVEDTEAMLAQADAHPEIVGVVGWVDLTDPAAARATLERFASDPRFVGVRHLIHDEPDPDWLLQDTVLDTLGLLVDHDLSFDVVAVLPRHLEHVPRLARRHPELRLVIDHLAKPPIREKGWQPWASLLEQAAAFPTVHAKVSGLDTAADWRTWTTDDLAPYVEHALELFGPDRLMAGGDWPISVLAGGYRKVWAATDELLAPLSDEQRRRVLGETAVEFYRIPEAP
ncbi:L-fuconolactonase [Haloactinopolyspora alba]|uniref:L-fuconolactonase n=1 Tax=Haloactinopolyspora alba TaxID=648780 RepID=A0A2P8EFJ3_9ACTN|nr:amidohydrolase family protein [Haloactinopolyspora alba]PSL08223.1 L-fuconolactonase [Haloactinopolyspora alba]